MYHLLLHEVDLSRLEDACTAVPVLVLQRSVVDVLGGADESGKEETMSSAWHTWNRVSRQMCDTWSGGSHPER